VKSATFHLGTPMEDFQNCRIEPAGFVCVMVSIPFFLCAGVLFYSFSTSSCTMPFLRGVVLIYSGIGLLGVGLICLMISLFFIRDESWTDDGEKVVKGSTKRRLTQNTKVKNSDKKDNKDKIGIKFKHDVEIPLYFELQDYGGRGDANLYSPLDVYPPIMSFHRLYHPQEFRLQSTLIENGH